MSNFDERSGVVCCKTDWGEWWQTMEEVYVCIQVPSGSRARDLSVLIKPHTLKVIVQGKVVIDGKLHAPIIEDDSTWTLEDKTQIRILLTKVDRTAGAVWRSLLHEKYTVDSSTFDQMQQKMTLQRMQYENPGMDFSSADITGNYQNGGPQLS